LTRYTETLSRSEEPIAGALQKPADLLLKLKIEHKKAMQVERSHEPAVGKQPFTSEYAINAREGFRVEICIINGRQVVRLLRWKRTAAGKEKRTGCAFEFAAYRCGVVASLIADIERELGRMPNAAA
jgi:hypothetical protein